MQSVSGEGVNLGPQGGGGGAAKADERKVEKTAFSVKLEKYDASAKIMVIKEVRAFTNLGLKEAEDLVKKVPTMLKQVILKEEANEIDREDKGCWWSCSYGVNSSNLFGILGSLLEEI